MMHLFGIPRSSALLILINIFSFYSITVANTWSEWAKDIGKDYAKQFVFHAAVMVALPVVVEKSVDFYYYVQNKENPIHAERQQKKDYLKSKTDKFRSDVVLQKQEEIDGEEIITQRRIKTLHMLVLNASDEQERKKYKKEYDMYVEQVLARFEHIRTESLLAKN